MRVYFFFLLGQLTLMFLCLVNTPSALQAQTPVNFEAIKSKLIKNKNLSPEEQLKLLQSMTPKNTSPEAEKELEERLQGMLNKTPIGPFVSKHPKILSFMARLMRDPEVMAGAMETISQPKTMERYRNTVLALILIGFLLSFFGKKNQTLSQRLKKKFFIFVFFTTAQLAVFVYSFQRLSHAVYNLFKQTFL